MLQTRVGKRTAAAAFRIAIQLVDEGVIDMDEALRRVSGHQLAQLMFPTFDVALRTRRSPGDERIGAAVGQAVFDSRTAIKRTEAGDAVILFGARPTLTILAGWSPHGVLTSRGGKDVTRAVVARGMGKTAVCGAGFPRRRHRRPAYDHGLRTGRQRR